MHLGRTALVLLTTMTLAGLGKMAFADTEDDYLKAQMTARNIPGLSVAVVQDGKLVKSMGYGLADTRLKVPSTAGTVYQIASLTKQFTAAAILRLQEQGKIGIDDLVSKYVDGVPVAWSAITVRELLNQTSGIPDYMAGFDLDTQVGPTPKNYTAAEILGLVDKKPLLFTPGSEFRYSNTNYHLLGMIVEKVSGQSYGAFLQQTFFGPLGMKDTQMARPGLSVPNAAVGTVWDGKTVEVSPIIPSATISFGDTGVQATVLDLLKWSVALDGDTLLSAASKRLLWTPPQVSSSTGYAYAAGWIVEKPRGHRLLWHNGETFSGFSSALFKFPDDKLTLIVLVNSLDLPTLNKEAPMYALMLGLAKQYLPDLAKPVIGIPETSPQTAALVKTVITQLASGTLDKSLIAPAYSLTVLTPDVLASAQAALAPLGPLSSLTLVSRAPDGATSVYRALYGARAVTWTVTLTKEKIAALGFQETE